MEFGLCEIARDWQKHVRYHEYRINRCILTEKHLKVQKFHVGHRKLSVIPVSDETDSTVHLEKIEAHTTMQKTLVLHSNDANFNVLTNDS